MNFARVLYLASFVIGILPKEEPTVGQRAPQPAPGSESAHIVEHVQKAALFDGTARTTFDRQKERLINGRFGRHIVQEPLPLAHISTGDAGGSHQCESWSQHGCGSPRTRYAGPRQQATQFPGRHQLAATVFLADVIFRFVIDLLLTHWQHVHFNADLEVIGHVLQLHRVLKVYDVHWTLLEIRSIKSIKYYRWLNSV